MAQRKKEIDLTSGSITKNIFSLAWPVVATMLLETTWALVNAFWVGKLGAISMAAVISSIFLVWIIYSLAAVISTGIVATVSRYMGARNEKQAGYVASQAISFAILASLILSLIGVLITKSVFVLMGTEKEVSHLGTIYLRITFLGTIFFFLIDSLGATFRASGDTKTPMRVSLFAVGLNIVLDPILIFGWIGLPRLESAGAAVATLFSQGTGVLIYLLLLRKNILKFGIKPSFKFDFPVVFQIIKIGLPTSISGILFSIVYLFINKITAIFGTETIAALGIGNRLESVSYLTCFGFSIAAATLVGQNLGASKAERAEESAWTTVKIVVLITGFVSVMFLALPRLISSFFISDPKVISISIDYLRILALSQIFMALEIILEGAFSGAGNTIPPMVVSIPGSLARIPLAYFLSLHLGLKANGIWWALTLTSIAKGTALALWFKKGRWKTKKI
jgi:putative MATE family efflux protein